MKGVSLVVCTYDRAALLDRLLAALGRLEPAGPPPLEVVVVDDASRDDTPAVLARAAAADSRIRTLPGPGRGIAAARNLGVEGARGEWIAFCDDDQLPAPDWLAQLFATANRRGARVVAGARRLRFTGPEPPLDPRLRTYLGEEVWAGEERPLRGWELPNTGNVLLRRELFADQGLFAPDLVEGGEDTDFFRRLHLAGEPMWTAPAAVVEHLCGPERAAPSWLLWRARRGGAAEARIRRLRGGLARGCLRWALLAPLEGALWLAAILAGRRRSGLYRRYVTAHALAFLRAALRPGGKAVDFRLRGYEEKEDG